MSLEVRIYGITGKSPFDVYICEGNGQNCLYINRITENSYNFTIPKPYDLLDVYLLKIIDANKFIITGVQTVE
jgi:hypothetical protein